jgi:hypothetical protein
MRSGLSIADLISARGPVWWSALELIKTEDSDAQQIDALLLYHDLSPEGAAYRLLREGVPYRRIEGLKYLAREREEKIMSALGDPIPGLVEGLAAGKEVRVHVRRARRVAAAAARAGLETEAVYVLKAVRSRAPEVGD